MAEREVQFVSLRMTSDLVAAVDALAAEEERTRSSFVRRLIKAAVAERKPKTAKGGRIE